MSLFKSAKPEGITAPKIESAIPVSQIDLASRYDIYCSFMGEERLYEGVKITGIRTLDRISDFGSALIGGFVEIEASNGARMMIPCHMIQMLCDHGMKPAYRVLRSWVPPGDGDSWKNGPEND